MYRKVRLPDPFRGLKADVAGPEFALRRGRGNIRDYLPQWDGMGWGSRHSRPSFQHIFGMFSDVSGK